MDLKASREVHGCPKSETCMPNPCEYLSVQTPEGSAGLSPGASGRHGAEPGSHQALIVCPNHGLAFSSYRAAIPGTRKVGHIQQVHSQRVWNPKTCLRSQMMRWDPKSALGCIHKWWEGRWHVLYIWYSWDLTGETVAFWCPHFRKDISGEKKKENWKWFRKEL